MIHPYECTQCGSTDFSDLGSRRVQCTHCGSLFQVLTGEPQVTINKGARVVFGKNSDVEVRGDIEVQDGANVEILGKVSVVKGNKKQQFKLKLIQANAQQENPAGEDGHA